MAERRLASRAQPSDAKDLGSPRRHTAWDMFRIYHSVYDIETTLGPAYLYPPQEDGSAKLVLKTESSMSPGRLVKLPGEVLAKLEALRPELTKLNA